MNEINATVRVTTHTSVNDFPFGASPGDLVDLLGQADNSRENYTGELEMMYGDAIYRFLQQSFVECTFPASHRFVIDGISVLSVFEWLTGQEDFVAKARFRISLQQGIAYDFRNPEHGSITIFARGHWDMLLLSN